MNEIHTWKLALVRQRAKQLGLHGSDLDDAQQEIALDVLAFQYQPDRSNGATEQTALTAFIDGRLKTMLRSKRRYQHHLDQLKQFVTQDAESIDAMRVDVHLAIAQLPERERTLCLALSRNENLREIAERWGCSWHTVARCLARVRRHFLALGLDDWLR
jgi:RNA polymerase sigma factor (sigma-70 family)